MADRPSLQTFLTTLDRRLAQMSADEIRTAVRAHAATLPGDQRLGFAEIFVRTAPVDETQQSTWPVEDDPLLDDIDDLVERISSGDYFEGFGWDPEIHDQRSFGDESWVWEMDGLFDAAQAAFLAGDLGLARAAYERLLTAFRLDEEVGTFCGQSPPVEMVSTDIAEAEARYLRSVYETTQPAQRAAALSDEWFELSSYGLPTLAAVRESRPNDLPGVETFLPDWITELTSVAAEQPGATARRTRLARRSPSRPPTATRMPGLPNVSPSCLATTVTRSLKPSAPRGGRDPPTSDCSHCTPRHRPTRWNACSPARSRR